MLSRLLACLALLTGLAAFGAPANAAVVETPVAQVEVAFNTGDSQRAERRPCQIRRSGAPAAPAAGGPCRARKPVVIYVPAVLLGPDRARE